jgi:hypothetical protein
MTSWAASRALLRRENLSGLPTGYALVRYELAVFRPEA